MKTGTARYAQHYEIATYGESRVREGYAHWSGTFALGNFDSNSDLEIASCVLGSMYKGSGVKYYCRFWFSDITI